MWRVISLLMLKKLYIQYVPRKGFGSDVYVQWELIGHMVLQTAYPNPFRGTHCTIKYTETFLKNL